MGGEGSGVIDTTSALVVAEVLEVRAFTIVLARSIRARDEGLTILTSVHLESGQWVVDTSALVVGVVSNV